jgi:hypothetical protein
MGQNSNFLIDIFHKNNLTDPQIFDSKVDPSTDKNFDFEGLYQKSGVERKVTRGSIKWLLTMNFEKLNEIWL